jgi:molybdopterin/thiamine biosynthesis adenylyltransferase
VGRRPDSSAGTTQAGSSVVLGLGGVGSQVAYLLATVGIGELVICDFDTVEASNLNRQMLYYATDLGRSKVEVAQERLRLHNPEVVVTAHNRRLGSVADILEVCAGADLVVKAVDTPDSILTMCDEACRHLEVPYVGGGFIENDAVVGPFVTPDDPALPEFPRLQRAHHQRQATFAPYGFWVASFIVGDVVRHLTRIESPWLSRRMMRLDGATGEVHTQVLFPN